jgi:hypothetical protein
MITPQQAVAASSTEFCNYGANDSIPGIARAIGKIPHLRLREPRSRC